MLLRRSDWLDRIEGLRGIAVSTHAQSGVSRQKDEVFWDEVVRVVCFAPECFLQRCLVAVLPHRRNREEMLHRGDPGRDDDHR